MDVLFEGANVDRHLDQMLHNEQCNPANTPPWLYLDGTARSKPGKCSDMASNVKDACTKKNYKNDTSGACCDAKKCVLSPHGSQPECCGNDQTKHHVVPDHCFRAAPKQGGDYYPGVGDMSYGKGLCICVNGQDKNEKRKQHARIHKAFDKLENKYKKRGGAGRLVRRRKQRRSLAPMSPNATRIAWNSRLSPILRR